MVIEDIIWVFVSFMPVIKSTWAWCISWSMPIAYYFARARPIQIPLDLATVASPTTFGSTSSLPEGPRQ